MNLSSLATKTGTLISKNSPAILMGFSLAGVIATAYLAHKAAQKSLEDIRKYESKENGLWIKASPKEKFKLTWQNYIPVALSCGVTLTSIISGNTLQFKRQAALVTAVTLSETALSEYKEKIVETLGKNKERKAEDELIQKKVSDKEQAGAFTLLSPREDHQEQYVMDTYSGRVFVSSIESLHRAANEVARECINNDYASLNLFYNKVGLPEIPVGDEVGWNNTHPMEIDMSNAVVHENRGLIAIRYVNRPMVGYDKLW